MSKLKGGIFSKPSGQTAGLVFGAARTRSGKVATVRQLVPPSNPNTPAQQQQRNKFKESLNIVRGIGASVYKDDFNRAISQLPGFQSLMSIVVNNMTSTLEMTTPPATNLGTLHFPSTFNWAPSDVDKVRIDFSTELGATGAETDSVGMIVIQRDASLSPQSRIIMASKNASTRGAGFVEMDVGTTGLNVVVGVYFHGSDVFSGLLSQCRWIDAQSG